MSKRNLKRPSWSPAVRPAKAHLLDRMAAWISRRSRLVRVVFAGITAIAFTAAIALIAYSIAQLLFPVAITYAIIMRPDMVIISSVVLGVIGLLMYWIGWRLMIGFDFAETPMKPGRPAVVWLLSGTFVALSMIIIGVATVSNALQ